MITSRASTVRQNYAPQMLTLLYDIQTEDMYMQIWLIIRICTTQVTIQNTRSSLYYKQEGYCEDEI